MTNAYQNPFEPRLRDTNGRFKVSMHQNVYDADFEYGLQPLRWETYLTGSATVSALPGIGGVQMQISALGDIAVRQSRPYHRYQPGKSIYLASNVNFGGPITGQVQRVGLFDDGNGIFFEQGTATTANPYGMFVVVRSDSQGTVGGIPVDTKISLENWNGEKSIISTIDWTRVQMIWVEYSWYGAGALRWGVLISGEPVICHQIGTANNNYTGSAQTLPWSRTGNLPARYEQRNITSTSLTTFKHFGVSVLIEGGIDTQRGFTYSYGMATQLPRRTVAANTVRYPVLSVQPNLMGAVQYANTTTAATAGTTTTLTVGSAVWTANQWVGRMLYYVADIGGGISTGTVASQTGTITFTGSHNLVSGDTIIISGASPTGWNGIYTFTKTTATAGTIVFGGTAPAAYSSGATVGSPYTARITSNTTTALTFGDVVSGLAMPNAPTASRTYQIGLIDRGQLLPQTLLVSASGLCVVELIASTPGNSVSLQGASFAALSTLGSPNSFASRDVTATGLAGGEVVYAFTAPAGGSGLLQIDLSNFFPILNTIRGNQPDILTVAISTQAATSADVGAHMICQEAMS